MSIAGPLGRALYSPSKGGGFAAQREALRSYIAANPSLVPSTASSSPAITLGTSTPTLGGATVSRNDARLRYLGGRLTENYANTQPGTFPQNSISTTKNVSFSSTERTTVAAIMEFDTTCPRFEVQEFQGGGVGRILVDNQIAGSWTSGSGGSQLYRLFDFTAIDPNPAQRRIRLEWQDKNLLSAIRADTTGAILSLLDAVSYRICFLGDSFTEGTGVGAATRHASYGAYCAKLLGFRDYWLSGFGGTSYNLSFFPGFGSTRPALVDRVGWDGVGADVFVVAMGINGVDGDATLAPAVATTLDTLRANNPNSLIMVLGPWGNGSGGAVKPLSEAIIEAACVGRPGVKFESVFAIPFTKFDATHPDAAGHVTLGTAVSNRIRAWVRA